MKPNLLSDKKNISIKEIFSSKVKNIYLLFTVILMVFFAFSQVVIISWTPTFFRIDKMYNLYSAGLIISMFWVGMLIGRLIISFLSYKFKAGILLISLSLISIIGLIITIYPNNQIINFIGVGLIGLGFSGIAPLLVSTAANIYSNRKDIVLAILYIVVSISGTLGPFVIKIISKHSIVFSMSIVIPFMGTFLVFALIRRYYSRIFKVRKSKK